MMNIKAIAFFLISLSVSTVSIAQIAEKTLVKSFNLQGNIALDIDLNGQVDVQTWSKSTVRIQMNIALMNRPVTFLKGMISAGRYNLTAEEVDNKLKISSPGMGRKVKLKEGELEEIISYIVYTPENVHVVLSNETSSNLEESENTGRIK